MSKEGLSHSKQDNLMKFVIENKVLCLKSSTKSNGNGNITKSSHNLPIFSTKSMLKWGFSLKPVKSAGLADVINSLNVKAATNKSETCSLFVAPRLGKQGAC